MRASSVLILCLLVSLTIGCNVETPTESASVSDNLFDLPPSKTPPGKQVRFTQVTAARRYAQYNYDLQIPSGDLGFTGRHIKVLIPDVAESRRLACLFYNPAGATVFTGKSAGTASTDPILPYVNAGFAVVVYGTDGGTVELTGQTSAKVLAQQAHLYGLSHAGLVNGRNAIDFALKEFPSIDEKRLFAIGHSSGGKQALLLAAADSRIAGCVAFAPACDISKEESEMLTKLRHYQRSLPVSFLEQANPMAFADRLTVPTLVVYSTQDEVVSAADIVRFGQAVGSNIEVRQVSAPDHFRLPELAFGIAQSWLSRNASQGALPITTVKNSNELSIATHLGRSSTSNRSSERNSVIGESKPSPPRTPASQDGVRVNPYAR
ncbi:MAG: prolyl oligopeptidase family serine peptidase [Pirellulaceae bacterium]